MQPFPFVPLSTIIKSFRDQETQPALKVNASEFEQAVFKYLETRQPTPTELQMLQKQYAAEIQNSRLAPKQQHACQQMVQGLLDHFSIFSAIKTSIVAGLPLKLPADRLSSLRKAMHLKYQRRKAVKEFEEFSENLQKLDREEAKLESEEYEALEKKLKDEEAAEEKNNEHYDYDNPALTPVQQAATLAPLPNQNDVPTQSLSAGLARLSHDLHFALKGVGVELALKLENMEIFNKNTATLENNARNLDSNNQVALNQQFNQTMLGLQQQYQTMQAAIPSNNPAAQQLLQQWSTQAGQTLTQWVATGQVPSLDADLKNTLDRERGDILQQTQTSQVRQDRTNSEVRTRNDNMQNELQAKQAVTPTAIQTPKEEPVKNNKRSLMDWPPKPKGPGGF